MGSVSVLQSSLMPDPSFQVSEYSVEEIEQAARVARRLLGPPRPAGPGIYQFIRAMNNIPAGTFVNVNSDGDARKWDWRNNMIQPCGMTVSNVMEGNYGWIIKS
jgi:hypothetical protein